jgi:hypothetical protein
VNAATRDHGPWYCRNEPLEAVSVWFKSIADDLDLSA